MSEHQPQTWTERCRDQRRIEALEAELGRAKACLEEINSRHNALLATYSDLCHALGDAREWRANAALWAISAALAAVLALRLVSP